MNKLPEGAYTLQDDEGCSNTRDAFEAAARDKSVIYCVASDRAEDDPEYLAVMISPRRYEELLESEWMLDGLRK